MVNIKNKKSAATILLLAALPLILTIPPATSQNSPQWSIQVSDLSGTLVTVTYSQLSAMPQTTVNAELRCYGSLVAEGDWVGVKIPDLLNALGINYSSVYSIGFTAADHYSVGIPIDYALRPDVIIAYQRNGVPLDELSRLIIPFSNGEVWISTIVAMSLSGSLVSAPAATTASLPPTSPGPGSLSQSLTNDVNTNQVQNQPPAATPTPTPAPTNTTVSAPQPPPTASTPTSPPATEQAARFPSELIYAAVLGAFLAVAAASVVLIRRRNRLN
ncbi:MAG: molybdopterin-dependent oxidoreductase [Candidatus Bathyarchaeota archaeon]|nr:molybdopterin-dependent oxidoreductase [Candidatus Bathyarchaeota archaeon]